MCCHEYSELPVIRQPLGPCNKSALLTGGELIIGLPEWAEYRGGHISGVLDPAVSHIGVNLARIQVWSHF